MEQPTTDIITELQSEPAKQPSKRPRDLGKQFDERGMSYEHKKARGVLWALVIVVVIAGLGIFFTQTAPGQQILRGNNTNTSTTTQTSATTSSASAELEALPAVRTFTNSDGNAIYSDLETDTVQLDKVIDQLDLYSLPNWELEFGWEAVK